MIVVCTPVSLKEDPFSKREEIPACVKVLIEHYTVNVGKLAEDHDTK